MEPACPKNVVQEGKDLTPCQQARGFRAMVLASTFAVVAGEVFYGSRP